MRNVPAIFLLIVFSTMQYGKLISYWNCKVVNSSDPKAVQCDCEKILITNDDAHTTVLATIQKLQTAEDFVTAYSCVRIVPVNLHPPLKVSIKSTTPFPTGFSSSVFQPPRM